MPDATPSPSLLSALARILSPVARLMLARGVTLPLAVELLKRVYIDVARRDFRLEGKSATDSRISLLTGVHRKDVRRLRELPAAPSELPAKVSFGAQAVARWTTVADFLDSSGQPRALPRQARAGEASFESLVGGISRDIRPRSLLDEWLRLGIVRMNERDEVVLITAAFVPRDGEDEKLAYFGHNLGDHASAAADNVFGHSPAWFERSVHHTEMTQEAVVALHALVADQGMALLQDLHRHAEAAAPPEPGDRGERFTCGIYFYSKPTLEDDS